MPPSVLTPSLTAQLVELRRDFHRFPEIAHQEHRTADIVARRLRSLGLDDVRTGIGITGVVATLRGGRPGRTVLLRADMDALPLAEADRGQPYRSQNEGSHHACGHDGHTAMLLTVAEILAARRVDLPGVVSFVFQPAEERVGGAKGMLEEGALDPHPDGVFALHLWNELPVGRVDARPGAVFANADAFHITIEGGGGHGAAPHQTVDPVAASAYLITTLQTLVTRETAPLEPAVLTIGSIHGGTAPNIIPARVDMQGTLRTFDDRLRERLLQRIQDMIQSVAATFRVTGTFTMTDGTPACVNDAEMAALVTEVATELLGAESVSASQQTCGADDMSLFLQAAPGCYFLIGSANAERGLASPHHSPTFDFDERALEIGAELMTRVALRFLEEERDEGRNEHG